MVSYNSGKLIITNGENGHQRILTGVYSVGILFGLERKGEYARGEVHVCKIADIPDDIDLVHSGDLV